MLAGAARYKYSGLQSGHIFKFHAEKKPYAEARSICLSEKASLLIVDSYAKQQWINNELPETKIWLALIDYDGDHKWHWEHMDGSHVALGPYEYWYWDSDKQERCVVTRGRWNDISCNQPFSFVCETIETGSYAEKDQLNLTSVQQIENFWGGIRWSMHLFCDRIWFTINLPTE